MVDDSREEHRMLIFGNDSDLVQNHLIVGEGLEQPVRNPHGILERKIHADSYTVTLYALLKDYGLTPVIRIKPRIRFHRSNYDNLSSSAPLRYRLSDIVHFAELKRGIDLTEKVDTTQLERIFGDAPSLEDLSQDPALQLVAQRDLFLRQPPFKTKTKVFGEGSDTHGIPIGKFLDALNHPDQTETIFKAFPKGNEFARDLLEALEPYKNLEFQFGVYSRYERRDCVLTTGNPEARGGYRTTFDPWTVLGFIKSDGDTQQFQILAHERGTRWEHKIMAEEMDEQTLELISQKIRSLRQKHLIARVLSKSQTGLTLLANVKESQLNLTSELFSRYQLNLEVEIPSNRFFNIESRRKLRSVFNANHQYQLHPSNKDMVEKHLNLARGIQNDVVYTLDNVYLTQGVGPQKSNIGGLTIIREPRHQTTVIRSAQDLRERMPVNGFERCWNETIDEGGYTIINKKTGRCYTVSYGKHTAGNIHDRNVIVQEPRYYFSIRYLGITPDMYQPSDLKATAHPRRASRAFFNIISKTEDLIIKEMRQLISHLRNKLSI